MHRVRASRPVPNPLPLSPPPLSTRCAVLHTDMTSSSVINSQFFASIFNLTQKLARVTPYLGATAFRDGRRMMEQHVHCKFCGREVTPPRYGSKRVTCSTCLSAFGVKERARG